MRRTFAGEGDKYPNAVRTFADNVIESGMDVCGPKGKVLKAGRAGPMDFWTYVLAYRIAGDRFMWEMIK